MTDSDCLKDFLKVYGKDVSKLSDKALVNACRAYVRFQRSDDYESEEHTEYDGYHVDLINELRIRKGLRLQPRMSKVTFSAIVEGALITIPGLIVISIFGFILAMYTIMIGDYFGEFWAGLFLGVAGTIGVLIIVVLGYGAYRTGHLLP